MINNIICGWKHKALGLLLVRLALGGAFLYHGYGKLMDMEGTISFFSSLGFNSFLAYVVAIVETVGGIAIILGVGTGLAGILLAIVMVVAILKVKLPNGGITKAEIDLVLLALSLGIIFTGPGKYSLHDKFCKNCNCLPETPKV